MNNHPWTLALFALSQVRDDAKNDKEAVEALEVEDISLQQLDTLIESLSQICDSTIDIYDPYPLCLHAVTLSLHWGIVDHSGAMSEGEHDVLVKCKQAVVDVLKENDSDSIGIIAP